MPAPCAACQGCASQATFQACALRILSWNTLWLQRQELAVEHQRSAIHAAACYCFLRRLRPSSHCWLRDHSYSSCFVIFFSETCSMAVIAQQTQPHVKSLNHASSSNNAAAKASASARCFLHIVQPLGPVFGGTQLVCGSERLQQMCRLCPRSEHASKPPSANAGMLPDSPSAVRETGAV